MTRKANVLTHLEELMWTMLGERKGTP